MIRTPIDNTRYVLLVFASIFFSVMALPSSIRQARRDSNPQPTVLETVALPIELLAYQSNCKSDDRHRLYNIFDTTPAPTVFPPSRIANFKPSSIAIGVISSTFILTLSPGITISVSLGSSIAPVTSVVLK